MRKFVIFALILFACSEETYIKNPCHLQMTISDALPVQFWLANCDTYNESDICGINANCFCQPFNCDDEIVLQLTDTTNLDYYYTVLDENGAELYTETFTKASEITSAILGNITTGSNYGTGDKVWTTGANPTVTGLTQGLSTETFRIPITNSDIGEAINFTFNLDLAVTGSGGTFNTTPTFYLYNSDMSQSVSVGGGDLGGVYISAGNKIETHTLRPTFAPAYLAIKIVYTGAGGYDCTFDINSVTINNLTEYYSVYSASFVPSTEGICDQKIQIKIWEDSTPDVLIAKSDCLDIRTSHDCSYLIQYSNHRNYAGLDYSNISPDTTFYLRAPIVFFHERFPEEDEAIELSSRVIMTNSVMRAQRLLDTDFMPYYMHKKLQLVLKHQTVEIDGREWTKQDAYEIQDGNRLFPKKKAKCWLTEKDFIQRNVV